MRCCLALDNGTDEFTHLFIFVVDNSVDKIYMVMKFPDELQEKLDLEAKKSKADATKGNA